MNEQMQPLLSKQNSLTIRAQNSSNANGLPQATKQDSPAINKAQNTLKPSIDKDLKVTVQPNKKVPGKQIAPGQPATIQRDRQKVVPLPAPDLTSDSLDGFESEEEINDFESYLQCYCFAENLDLNQVKELTQQLSRDARCEMHHEILYAQVVDNFMVVGEAYYFEYGAVVFWALNEKKRKWIMQNICMPCASQIYQKKEAEFDDLLIKYLGTNAQALITNDQITLPQNLRTRPMVRMAIAHAIAQSTKLNVYEGRALQLVETCKDFPIQLATKGTVHVSRRKITQLIGKIFIEQSNVNLLSNILDTPEFFWSKPDYLQKFYYVSFEYMEVQKRVEVLNTRFVVLQDMLNLIRDHQNYEHGQKLEWAVIWLIVAEVFVTVIEWLYLLRYENKS